MMMDTFRKTIFGLVSLGGTGRDNISMQFASWYFWPLYMGGCQAALAWPLTLTLIFKKLM